MKLHPALLALALIISSADAHEKTAPPPPLSTPLAKLVDGLPVGPLPRQELAVGQCAAFLWTQTPGHALVAMVSATPALIRYAPDGVVTDLPRTAMSGDDTYGLTPKSSYAGSGASIDINLTIEQRAALKDGAAVPEGTISISRAGADTVVVPVAGLIGCG
jgi:hypothetical protein